MDSGLSATEGAPAPAGALVDDVAPVRLTSTPTVGPPTSRTAAATAARRRSYVSRIALDLACRLDDLDDERLHVLAWTLLEECRRRGIGRD